jgi:hypothetical protein
LFCEEIRQFAEVNTSSSKLRRQMHFNNKWNYCDLVMFIVYFAGLSLRFFPVSICDTCFYAARIILAIDYMIFFIRMLQYLSVYEKLGPKLVMIYEMMIDLFYFMMILMVFVAAFGIGSQVILYPNSPLNINLAVDILKNPWWAVFQQFNIDEVSGASCTNLSATASSKIHDAFTCAAHGYETSTCLNKEDLCPAIDWLMPIALAIYALIAQVMMMNLLIAMFSNTFAKVQENTNVTWKMQRYRIVSEFYRKPALFPPFIIIIHSYRLVRYLLQFCNFRQTNSRQFGFCVEYTEEEKKKLTEWERVKALEYLRKIEATKHPTFESPVITTNKRLKSPMCAVDELIERGTTMLSGTVSAANSEEPQKLHPPPQSELTSIKKEVRRTSELVESLTKLMKEMNSRPAVAAVTTTASASTADALDVESRQGNRLSQYTD